MNRRTLLQSLAALPLVSVSLVPGRRAAAAPATAPASAPASAPTEKELQNSWKSLLDPSAEVATTTEPLKLTPAEWKKRLTPEAYHVLREEGTERAGTSLFLEEHRAGVFVCAGCSLPLFTSAMKFDSGTGWPSFFTSISGVLGMTRDLQLGVPRTEYHCIRCGGHHGHVFEDGPKPTGLRYCNNGVALRFIPKLSSGPASKSPPHPGKLPGKLPGKS